MFSWLPVLGDSNLGYLRRKYTVIQDQPRRSQSHPLQHFGTFKTILTQQLHPAHDFHFKPLDRHTLIKEESSKPHSFDDLMSAE